MVKQLVFRTLLPMPVCCNFLWIRYGPIGVKPTKMIDAHDVVHAKHSLHAFFPPSPVVLFMGIPIVEDSLPNLSRFTEVVGWNTGNVCWVTVLIKLEQFSMRPDISRVVSDENWHVTNHSDVVVVCVCSQATPFCSEGLLFKDVWLE